MGKSSRQRACKKHRGRKELTRLLWERVKGVRERRDEEMAGLGMDL